MAIVGGIQRQAGRGHLARHDRAARQGLRRAQFRADGIAVFAQQLQRHHPRDLLEQENSAGRGGRCRREGTLARQHERGSDIRMSGEGHFGAGSEHSHLRGMLGVVRRQHEGRFRVVELQSDGLHLAAGEVRRVQDHGEWIAAEHPVGEHIGRDIASFHCRPRSDHSVSERTSRPMSACTASRTGFCSCMIR